MHGQRWFRYRALTSAATEVAKHAANATMQRATTVVVERFLIVRDIETDEL